MFILAVSNCFLPICFYQRHPAFISLLLSSSFFPSSLTNHERFTFPILIAGAHMLDDILPSWNNFFTLLHIYFSCFSFGLTSSSLPLSFWFLFIFLTSKYQTVFEAKMSARNSLSPMRVIISTYEYPALVSQEYRLALSFET